jgi:hypothetical protein
VKPIGQDLTYRFAAARAHQPRRSVTLGVWASRSYTRGESAGIRVARVGMHHMRLDGADRNSVDLRDARLPEQGDGVARPAWTDRPPLLVDKVVQEVGSRHCRGDIGSAYGSGFVTAHGVPNYRAMRHRVIGMHRLNLVRVCRGQCQDELESFPHSGRVPAGVAPPRRAVACPLSGAGIAAQS